MNEKRASKWELLVDAFLIGVAVAMWPVADSAGVEFGRHWATVGHWFLSMSIAMNLFNGVERIVGAYKS